MLISQYKEYLRYERMSINRHLLNFISDKWTYTNQSLEKQINVSELELKADVD